MRRTAFWLPVGLLAAVTLALWGTWTWRLNTVNLSLSNALEAERQRSFVDLAYHVEELQALLGKGLATGNVAQNMRYMGEVNQHAASAVSNFSRLPLPAELSATTGRFLQQVGDFAASLVRNEAAGRPMGTTEREQLTRLRQDSINLSAQMNQVMAEYNQGGFRWNPPVRFSWANLVRGPGLQAKPNTQDQAPASMVPGGFEQVATSMEQLPVLIYDGPFSDHVDKAAPAMSGMPITQDDAARRATAYMPQGASYRQTGVTDVANNLPAWSFQLAPADTQGNAYVATVDIAKNGGHLVQLLNSRVVGNPTIDMARAQVLGQQYLANAGYAGMVPTYGQVQDGQATIAYAYREGNVLVYPDQVKVKVALDNGEILAVDARQFLMHHKARTVPTPKVTPQQAEDAVNPDLAIQRVQLALIPDVAGTGEILTYEFLTRFGDESFLVYINAETGQEEQILQLIQTDGGTFTL